MIVCWIYRDGVGAGLASALNQNNTNIYLGRQGRLPLQIKYHSILCDTFWGRGQKRSLHDTFYGPVPKRVTNKLHFFIHNLLIHYLNFLFHIPLFLLLILIYLHLLNTLM